VLGFRGPKAYVPFGPVTNIWMACPDIQRSSIAAPLNGMSAPSVKTPLPSRSQKTMPRTSPVVGVAVGVFVGVGVWVYVGVGVGVWVGVAVGVWVYVGVVVGVGVWVYVGVGVAVGVDVAVAVGVDVGV